MRTKCEEAQGLLSCGDRGDRERLLAEAFMRHRDRLRRMASLRLNRFLQGRVDPSDVVQEAYVEVSQRLDEYLRTVPMPLFLWFRRITGQRLVALHRFHLGAQARDARRQVSLQAMRLPEASSESIADVVAANTRSPSDQAIRKETRRQVLEALESMEALDREILVLRHFESLSSREAAEELGIREAAARQRYFRALKRFRTAIEERPGTSNS